MSSVSAVVKTADEVRAMLEETEDKYPNAASMLRRGLENLASDPENLFVDAPLHSTLRMEICVDEKTKQERLNYLRNNVLVLDEQGFEALCE